MSQPDDQCIEGWKFELALAVTTRDNIKALIESLESMLVSGKYKYSPRIIGVIGVILADVKRLDALENLK